MLVREAMSKAPPAAALLQIVLLQLPALRFLRCQPEVLPRICSSCLLLCEDVRSGSGVTAAGSAFNIRGMLLTL